MEIDKAVQHLQAVKQILVETAKDNQKNPTVIQAAQATNMFLDTAYLWLTQLHGLAEMYSPEAVEKVAEAALAEGNVVPVDFAGSVAAKGK